MATAITTDAKIDFFIFVLFTTPISYQPKSVHFGLQTHQFLTPSGSCQVEPNRELALTTKPDEREHKSPKGLHHYSRPNALDQNEFDNPKQDL
jgi:hypothetical protein